MTHPDGDEPEYDHETILQHVICALLTSDDLDELSRDAGTAVLIDRDGEPVLITGALSFHDAGVLSIDKGVYVELSDGSRFALTLSVSSRGHRDVTIRPPDTATTPPAPAATTENP